MCGGRRSFVIVSVSNFTGLGKKRDPFTEIITFFSIDQNHNKFYKYIMRYIYVNY